MRAFAELLDRLSFEPARNGKLRLLVDYLQKTPDPDRGLALAALTGALRFDHAKPALIRALVTERVDPVLFALSYDYVGDLSETAALIWPKSDASPFALNGPSLSLPDVIDGLYRGGKIDLPARLAGWFDLLDETSRWALLKLITGALRVGVSARLAKTAAAILGNARRTTSNRSGTVWSHPILICSPGWKGAARAPKRSIRPRSGRSCCRILWTKRTWPKWRLTIIAPNGNGTGCVCRRCRADTMASRRPNSIRAPARI